MVQTRSQTKASGTKLPEVHGVKKRLNPHKIPEKQSQTIVKPTVENKPRLGQGRAEIKRKVKLALPSATQEKREDIIGQELSTSQPITPINGKAAHTVIPERPVPILEIPRRELPSYILPRHRPPPKSPD